MFNWPVVPICDAQLLDVNPDDLLLNGLYRRCNTYKSGGGYDRFPEIWRRRFGDHYDGLNDQFVVQLKGCTLNCPYCYVTKAGVNGTPVRVSTQDMVRSFESSGCGVFHLMGGAPAIHLEHWPELVDRLRGAPFHSDFILNEKPYDIGVLEELASFNHQLYAVSIKGEDASAYLKNTNTGVDFEAMLKNLDRLVVADIPFYITFTGMSEQAVECFKASVAERYRGCDIFKDSFSIGLVDYDALHWEE